MTSSEKHNLPLSLKNFQQKKRPRDENITLSQEFMSGDVLLSIAQQRIWFLEQLTPGSPANHVSDGLLLSGHLDVSSLQSSLNFVIQRHEILRTVFEERNGVPAQKVLPNIPVHINEIDLHELEEGSRQKKIREISHKHTSEGFNLTLGPLMRLTLLRNSVDQYLLIATIHRIICDKASIRILFREMMEFYNCISKGIEPPTDKAVQFADFSKKQQRSYNTGLFLKQMMYWIDHLSDAPYVLSLPMDRPRPALQTFNGATYIANVEPGLRNELAALCTKEKTNLFTTLLTVFDILLHRYTREEDFLVGSLSPDRKSPDTQAVIGVFENILVHRADLRGDPTFREFLSRVRTTYCDALANQDLPFEKLVEELHIERALSHSPLFQVMFTLNNKEPENQFGGLRFENVRVDSATAKYDLTLEVEEHSDQITLVWKYSTDLFEDQTIERMSGHFLTLLESILQNPDQKISQVNILTMVEKDQLLQDWNQTGSNLAKNRKLEEIFQDQVDATPRSIAVVAGKKEISYRELDAKSNQLAHYLIRNQIGPGKIVALFMNRSIEMCIALLGIMKSGACYLPIDITYPADRIEFMLKDSNACMVVTQKSLRANLNSNIPMICVDSDWETIQNEKKDRLEAKGSSEDLIYIIYTSGSTGTPKGVMVRHRNVVNQALGVRNIYGLRADDRSLHFNSISFDVAAEELYSAWLTGSTLVLRTEQMLASFHTFLKEVEKYEISFLNLPTAYWHELVQEIQASGFAFPSCVRVVVVGGEKVSYSAYKQWLNIAGDSVLFFNGYGPTETTITSTVYKESPQNRQTAERIQDVPIGRPIPNTRIYVLSSNMQPVPIGVPGELWIGGEGVSCGYLNREELTKARFLDDPFLNDSESRIYKTGDLVRYLSDGNLQFFGRIDDQVKIRGFRVELGEIEAALLQHSNVREAAVTAPLFAGTTHIVAYVTYHKKPLTSKELRDFLNSKLPDYMIPTTFIFLENLPISPTGKIDRKKLPLPENLDAELQTNYVPPRDELELKLAEIWRKMLNVTKVGMKDNFFDLGGHSLLAVRLFSQIEKETGKNLPLATLFEAPTVEQLANILREVGWKPHWSSLVPIQPNGNRPPFFCIHAVGGNVIGYRPLAEYLSPDQPVYGLQARGLDGKQMPHIVLEEMAADYIREIKNIQPTGPYHLGGLSSGGVVAFEMGRQLIEMGDTVGVVAMFDTEAPTFHQHVPANPEVYHRGWSAYLERAKYHFHMLFFNKEWKNHIKLKFKTVRRRFRTRVNLANYNLQRKTGKDLSNTLLRVHEASAQALRDYHPGYYPGDLTLFLAIQRSVGEKVPPEIGWKPFARSIIVRSVPGDHLGILKEPNVRGLAESLQECIDEFSAKIEKKAGILMYLLFALLLV